MAADAHGVTDAHIADLKADGWSEEAIYEMVFVISFAAGVGRMERSVSVLRGR
jgi:alkylhydroperoxidase family enzyme